MSRLLTEQQHLLLDRIAKADADAVVIGWIDDPEGRGRGPLVQLSDGDVLVANINGHRRIYREAA